MKASIGCLSCQHRAGTIYRPESIPRMVPIGTMRCSAGKGANIRRLHRCHGATQGTCYGASLYNQRCLAGSCCGGGKYLWGGRSTLCLAPDAPQAGPQGQPEAWSEPGMVKRMLAASDHGTLKGLRDCALLSVAYDTLCWCRELMLADVGHRPICARIAGITGPSRSPIAAVISK